MRCPVLECCHEGTREVIVLHMRAQHPQVGGAAASTLHIFPFVEIRAFRGYLRTYRHRTASEEIVLTPGDYLLSVHQPVLNIIAVNTTGNRSIKVQISLVCQFYRGDEGTPYEERCVHFLNSDTHVVYNVDEFETFLGSVLSEIIRIVNIFQEHGSGWRVKKFLGSDIRVAKYNPLRGRCLIQIPDHIKRKRVIVNVRNLDNQCFKWAFLSIMHYKDVTSKNRFRVSNYKKFERKYNFLGIKFPITMRGITKFEEQNSHKLFAVNIFEEIDETTTIKRMSPHAHNPDFRCVDLLLIHDDDVGLSHYVGIVDIGKYFGRRNYHKQTFCYNCQRFYSTETFLTHTEDCSQFKTQRVKMPPLVIKNGIITKPIIKFKNQHKDIPHEYIMYLDLESLMNTNIDEPNTNNTTKLAQHIPSGFQLFLIGRTEKIVDYKLYRGNDCIKVLFQTIEEFVHRVKEVQHDLTPMKPLTPEQLIHYHKTNICWVCENDIPKFKKVKEHDHKTGEYRGPACYSCNSRYTIKRSKIPIFTHNFKNYDVHLIIEGFEFYNGSIKVIPSNAEKYVSIICDKFVFLDSMMFLSASLESLVSRLKESVDFNVGFKLMIQYFGSEKAMDLCRKGVYFYDYVTCFETFNETIFPTKQQFFNKLSDANISDEDYEYACYIYKKYCKNLGEYHDLYLITDTLLLACVMESFRDKAISFYDLDPAQYFTLSSYTWDAALKFTGVKLELITDPEIYQFFELGMRGGISMISTRFASANNRFLKSYNKELESSFIIPWDCNNLYGFALQQMMPVSDFKWKKRSFLRKITNEDILKWDDEGVKGYVLMVDVSYPKELHVRDSEYPLAPESTNVPYESLSVYQKSLLETLDIQYFEKTKKLVPHLGCRKRYVVHYRNLKYYIKKGLVVTKIHKILEFTQMQWLKPYIDFNTFQRQIAADQFSKDLFKFLINACFGKSCENVRKHREIEICNNSDQVEKLICKPSFKTFNIINPDVAIIEMEKRTVLLNKPIYTGFSTLDLSKLVMYEFHMDVVKKRYGERAKLLQTDTDSLSYHIKTKNLYKDMKRMQTHFDFSDYPRNHNLYSDMNKKIMGKFKDESNGKAISEYVGLAPKLYSFKGDTIWKKAAKGVKKSVVDKHLQHRKFKNVLMRQKKLKSKMNMIRSYKHKLYTISLIKTSLHAFDSKRFILDDGINTLAHQHYLTKL